MQFHFIGTVLTAYKSIPLLLLSILQIFRHFYVGGNHCVKGGFREAVVNYD